jgi:lincosamide nucleotidyltransferase A/C/D/E
MRCLANRPDHTRIWIYGFGQRYRGSVHHVRSTGHRPHLPLARGRPWNFVLHDAHARRVDLHFYERLDAERLHYGSAAAPFIFTEPDLSGQGSIAGVAVRCESPQFALQCHTGYQPREIDRRDVAALCKQFNLRLPDPYQQT